MGICLSILLSQITLNYGEFWIFILVGCIKKNFRSSDCILFFFLLFLIIIQQIHDFYLKSYILYLGQKMRFSHTRVVMNTQECKSPVRGSKCILKRGHFFDSEMPFGCNQDPRAEKWVFSEFYWVKKSKTFLSNKCFLK